MSEQFNDKDYGEYFSAVQRNIEKKATATGGAEARPSEDKTEHVEKDVTVKLRPWVSITAMVLAVTIVLLIVIPVVFNAHGKEPTPDSPAPNVQNVQNQTPDVPKEPVNNYASFTDSTQAIASDIESQSIIVVNCKTNQVVASRNAKERCYPASTTKIMTVLTACDYITDYDKTFTFSYEITDPLYVEEATMAGFADGEAVNMTDLLYGAILPSGADATVGLALSIAGSEQEFVKLMNKKAEELGLKNTNFVNSSGLFDPNHYTTAEDMAVIVRAAMQNETCKKILSTYQYTTAPTPQHPEGILLTSTMFSRMYGTEPEGSDILGGKTGFVNESGHCLASFGQSDEGTEYVCVTFKGTGAYPIVYDQIKLYTAYAK